MEISGSPCIGQLTAKMSRCEEIQSERQWHMSVIGTGSLAPEVAMGGGAVIPMFSENARRGTLGVVWDDGLTDPHSSGSSCGMPHRYRPTFTASMMLPGGKGPVIDEGPDEGEDVWSD